MRSRRRGRRSNGGASTRSSWRRRSSPVPSEMTSSGGVSPWIWWRCTCERDRDEGSDRKKEERQGETEKERARRAAGKWIGCLRKEGSTLPCCNSGSTTHGASSFWSSGV